MSHLNQNRGQLFNLIGHSYERDEFLEQGLEIGDYQLSFSHPSMINHNLKRSPLSRFHLRHYLNHKQAKVAAGHPQNVCVPPHSHMDEITGLLDAKYSHFKIQASLLDRPLILALEQPLYVPPLAQTQLSLSRPIAFKIIAHTATDELKLLINPTRTLRMTSYGLVTHPMLCYHWRALANERPYDGNEAIVPMLIQNQSKQVIELRKLILYKGFLKLFKTDNYFVTNEVKLKLTSKQEGFLEYLDQPSSHHGACDLIYESSGESSTKLLKLLRLVTKRGTGIEYGL